MDSSVVSMLRWRATARQDSIAVRLLGDATDELVSDGVPDPPRFASSPQAGQLDFARRSSNGRSSWLR
jgi:hypothetical protein